MVHCVFAHAGGRIFKCHMITIDGESCPNQTRKLIAEVFAWDDPRGHILITCTAAQHLIWVAHASGNDMDDYAMAERAHGMGP